MGNFEYFIEAGSSGGGNYEPAPEGTHRAVCSGGAFLGTFDDEYQGVKKTLKKIRLFFELSDETKTFDEAKGPEPLHVSKEFTFSWHEKSKLLPFINTWRGKAFTPDELARFNIGSIVGAPCALTIQHEVGKTSGKKYAEIKSATPLMKGTARPEPSGELFFYAVDKHDEATFSKLPEFVQNKIKQSIEWERMTAPAPAPVVASEDEEDLPF
jgi:hypothetical protein